MRMLFSGIYFALPYIEMIWLHGVSDSCSFEPLHCFPFPLDHIVIAYFSE